MTDSNGAKGALAGKTILMSGGSRGIGLAIALRAAADGANVAILAKTVEPHPALEGTIYTAAKEIEAAGGKALPIVGDVRNDDDVARAVAETVATFGGIDIVVNNASAIDLTPTSDISMKRYDLMADINVRGTFLLSKLAIPALKQAENPHILTLSPPLNITPKWMGAHTAYSMAKFGMSMTTMGLAAEFKKYGIGVNSLWPCTVIDTAAIRNMPGGAEILKGARSASIMADAAYAILTRSAKETTGNFFTDEQALGQAGVTDFRPYSMGSAEEDLFPDFFL
ncbi:MAG: NAD(P)-dependent oxidoreductase [Acidobacteria bacterium]|nr:NAD(P)-dependent oxidoreductase [Acidobacteriota bacterium]